MNVRVVRGVLSAVLLALPAACGGDDGGSGPEFVGDVRRAVEAVEDTLGGPQEYFEVTASGPLTNVFVAVDEATAAIPYVYRDGMLEEPGPKLEGAEGHTFTSDSITFDEEAVLAGISDGLPDATVESLSVEGGPGGSARFVVAARSQQGGVLDVVVGARGAIVSVEPR